MDEGEVGEDVEVIGEDEYHEDSMPDLIAVTEEEEEDGFIKVREDSVSSCGSLELRRISSTEDDEVSRQHHYDETDYEPNGAGSGGAEVLTEISSQGALKVSFVDHRKAYVPKVSGSEKYRAYLSLMPEDIEGGNEEEEEAATRRSQILSEFRALSYEEQMNQRIRWAKELERTLNDIAEVKEKLAFKTAWCRVLQKDLGITRWQIISAEVNDRVSELADHLQQALETTEEKIASGSTKGLQRARVSFEAFSSEVREKMRQIAAATKSERRKIEVRLATAALAAAERGFDKTGENDNDAAAATEKS